jgi:hypothetical protein
MNGCSVVGSIEVAQGDGGRRTENAISIRESSSLVEWEVIEEWGVLNYYVRPQAPSWRQKGTSGLKVKNNSKLGGHSLHLVHIYADSPPLQPLFQCPYDSL